MTGLKHGHLVEMRGFYKWDKAYCLALEHMAGGELCDDIIRRVNYSEADARNVSSIFCFFRPVDWRCAFGPSSLAETSTWVDILPRFEIGSGSC